GERGGEQDGHRRGGHPPGGAAVVGGWWHGRSGLRRGDRSTRVRCRGPGGWGRRQNPAICRTGTTVSSADRRGGGGGRGVDGGAREPVTTTPGRVGAPGQRIARR